MTKNFYIRWLKVNCIITFTTGIMAAAASTPASSGPWLMLFDMLKWPIDNNPQSFSGESFAINAVLGAVLMGWASMMYLLTEKYIKRDDNEIPGIMIISLTVWFITDCIGSVLANLPGNLALNIIFLLLFLPPLIKLSNTGNQS